MNHYHLTGVPKIKEVHKSRMVSHNERFLSNL